MAQKQSRLSETNVSVDETTRALLVTMADVSGSPVSPASASLQGRLLAAQGIMPVRVNFGVKTITPGANVIILHASTPCKYVYLFVDDGCGPVYIRPGGAAADSAVDPNQPLTAGMSGRLIVLDTPATSLTVFGVLASRVAWIAGNDA